MVAFGILTAGTVFDLGIGSINELVEVLVSDAEIFRRVVAKSSTGTIRSVGTIDHESIVEVVDIIDSLVEFDGLLFCVRCSRYVRLT
ncbi:hypothetical protein C451_19508 [Halococcus thailandensis JCM 13552]|uniref:Uncharacterized protein n=1 Tax=Halococcus thailandensis JCM 13552 TaxID=1227457 RepID=M0MTQ8_9EURY|nr:hypothetical protein C451_19508 [Halococcus thailandensis JCM 13552]